MGGEWGLGASLAMESLPTAARGLFSGILQQGYAVGYLLAALVYWIIFPIFGWRGLFVAGALPALLVVYIRAHVPESPVWQRHRERKQRVPLDIRGFIRQHGTLFVHAVLLMTAFNYMSHGTQDLYATFLERQRGFGVSEKSMISIIYAIGAICGGTVIGFFSQRWGRRRSIIFCAVCGLFLVPAWVFAPVFNRARRAMCAPLSRACSNSSQSGSRSSPLPGKKRRCLRAPAFLASSAFDSRLDNWGRGRQRPRHTPHPMR